MRVVVAGGGTAGHVAPGLALAARLRERGADVLFVGSRSGFEAELVPAAGVPFAGIEAEPFVRGLTWRALRGPVVALATSRRVGPLLDGADVVVGLGGYVSVPAGLAARRRRVPFVVHEQNAVPSLANRVLARWAAAVGISFADAAERFPARARVERTGNPVRPQVLEVQGRRDAIAQEARRALGLVDGLPTVLVMGGSQGALSLDRAVAGALPSLVGADVQLLVLTGRDHVEVVRGPAGAGPAPPTVVVGFLERIELAYAVAEFAVARAGASAIAELAVCGIPAVLVPYPYATDDHQAANARELVRAGAAEVIPDAELSPSRLARCILDLMRDRDRRSAMAAAMRAWAIPDADARLAELVLEVAGRR
ncbi:MAG: UDP-N-acetylglucosamine--N-acetylmuramyl-(pentapeptide) pyrophosphoryl-undecaprenol N-acetylglucosamine transferase [Actinomycetota bacterium]|nr:MAG: UDP-N-acetylglucosamine--N-acetylmuramyl-(pentapeptide) pyrophosphoryl-undecaprenol N-acetylglucosamine transferase [Actinomycetota bacterium]